MQAEPPGFNVGEICASVSATWLRKVLVSLIKTPTTAVVHVLVVVVAKIGVMSRNLQIERAKCIMKRTNGPHIPGKERKPLADGLQSNPSSITNSRNQVAILARFYSTSTNQAKARILDRQYRLCTISRAHNVWLNDGH